MQQSKSEWSKLSLNFELSFLYALFLATARHGLSIIEFWIFIEGNYFFGCFDVGLWKKLYTENKLERLQIERGIRICLI